MVRFVLAVVALAAFAGAAYADDDTPKGEKGRPVDKGALGVGIILGEPTGVCAKLYLKDDRAIQVSAGSAFVSGGLQLTGDYIFHPWILQDRDSYVLPAYIGPGVRVIDYPGQSGGPSQFAFGLRGVVGLLFDFKNVPLDAFVEVAVVAGYKFASGGAKGGFDPGINAGAGVRYYF
ncbi:MAG TPA: hypothetical protein VMJ10_10500 [Kofleriaceae bacterium]|nr:hypothetical protein [Kofleriaceae bacterium]